MTLFKPNISVPVKLVLAFAGLLGFCAAPALAQQTIVVGPGVIRDASRMPQPANSVVMQKVATQTVLAESTPQFNDAPADAADVPPAAPKAQRAFALCGDGGLVYTRRGDLCATRGGVVRLYH